ncbi:MAG: S26 family signal peptidase [Planctomycetota bacterium]
MGKDPAHRTPWRDNLEAAAMAILLALFLKAFLVEAYKIPSGSMQPTLMGMPTPGDSVIARDGGPGPEVKDRILVDKLTPRLRDPKRWEVLVFRYPLKRSQNFVKRMVGMPGEQLQIRNGDIFVRPDGEAEWSIPRRPKRVQEAHWRAVQGGDRDWRQTEGSAWRIEPGRIEATGEGVARFADGAAVLDRYFDGYPEAVRKALPSRHPTKEGTHPVGDLRLTCELRLETDCKSVIFELSEGDSTYRFLVPGPAADPEAKATIFCDPATVAEESLGRSVAESAGPLRAGRAVDVQVENLDDRLTLRLDGEAVVELDIREAARQQTTLQVRVDGGGATFDDLGLERDIFYFASRTSRFDVPDGHYFMLGDNTLNSSDGREWEAARFQLESDPETVLVGNNRPGDNPSGEIHRDESGRFFRFTDQWGTDHLLQVDETDAPETLPPWLERATRLGNEPSPFVERNLIVGRALAVFWPILPHKGIVRLEWVD